MKEDVLEQIVDDYLQHLGYFTRHNIRFRPSKDHPEFVTKNDSVHSDVDVVGIHPLKTGTDRVWVVSCKSWQDGFDATAFLRDLHSDRGNLWRHVRELWIPKWSGAFRTTIFDLTGSTEFTYHLAVTRLRGDSEAWVQEPRITENLGGNPFRFLTLETMWRTIVEETKTTMASSEIGRLAQLLKAARLTDERLCSGEVIDNDRRHDGTARRFRYFGRSSWTRSRIADDPS
jgi:hypothetical protein